MDHDGRLSVALALHGMEEASLEEIDAHLAGVLAAPVGHDPEAWLDLIAPTDAVELRALLLARLEQHRARPTPPSPPPVAMRLEHLRSALRALDLDGFIQPLTDEHRNEYIPDAAQRLAWLTGFTGSAGTVIVMVDRAVMFVDGRYTIQAEQQLDAALFDRAHLIDHPPAVWLAEHLKKGQRFGFDPTLHIKANIATLEKAAEKVGAVLVPVAANPIDSIWANRPPMPIAPLDPLDDVYAGEASSNKRVRMGEKVSRSGADVALISAPDSIAWLLNIRGGDVPFNPLTLAFALLHQDGAVEVFLDQRKLRPGQHLGNGVSLQPMDGLEGALDRLGETAQAVLIDPDWTNIALTERLTEAGAKLIEGTEPCILAKACKNDVEIEGARQAQRRDGAAVTRFLHWLNEILAAGEPITELDAAAALEAERRRDPLYRGPSFDTISAAGPNAALAHYRVTASSNRVLEAGSLYLVDSGGQYPDATTDITRTIAVGTPTEDMRRHFTLVLKGHIALDRAKFPVGTSGGQLDVLARYPLWQAGLDFDHGTGHGVGSYLCVHEGPARIAKSGTIALKPGMILSNEPGYYQPGGYGIRIENLVTVIEAPMPEGGERKLLGFENLTRAPLDRALIDAALLDDDERAWVDAYHALVRRDLDDHLEGPAKTWMRHATTPLEV